MTEEQQPSAGGPGGDGAGFDAVALTRILLRTARQATLATLEPDGAPFASLVNVATDSDGAPVFVASALARHARNLGSDRRVSLLLAPGGRGDALAHPRLTVTGRAEPTESARVRRRFLSRHPKAQLYVGLPGFAFWRVAVGGLHVVGGFARATDPAPADILLDLTGAETLLAAEAETIAQMNEDAAAAVARIATGLAGAPPGPWRLTGLDPEGVDLMAGGRSLRLAFRARVADPAAARQALADMAARAEDAG